MIKFILFLGTGQGLLFLIHFVFFKFGINQFGILLKHQLIFGIILCIFSLSFSLSILLVRYCENDITAFVYKLAAVWLGTIVWLFFALISSLLIQKSISENFLYFEYIPKILILCGFLISGWGIFNGSRTKIVSHNIYIENLPEKLEGVKAVFISDTHYGNIHTIKKSKEDVKKINALHPDILFMGGDFFDGPSNKIMDFAMPYKNIQPKLGKYFVSGNHEVYANLETSIDALKKVGFVITDNQNIDIEGIQIIGIPYTTSNSTDIDIFTTTSLLSKNYNFQKPSIVLKHVPINMDIISKAHASFVFSGHTHKGQMWPFSLVIKYIYKKHYYGLFTENKTIFYTSSGVGSWGPPQRIGTQSEILQVIFHKKNPHINAG